MNVGRLFDLKIKNEDTRWAELRFTGRCVLFKTSFAQIFKKLLEMKLILPFVVDDGLVLRFTLTLCVCLLHFDACGFSADQRLIWFVFHVCVCVCVCVCVFGPDIRVLCFWNDFKCCFIFFNISSKCLVIRCQNCPVMMMRRRRRRKKKKRKGRKQAVEGYLLNIDATIQDDFAVDVFNL